MSPHQAWGGVLNLEKDSLAFNGPDIAPQKVILLQRLSSKNVQGFLRSPFTLLNILPTAGNLQFSLGCPTCDVKTRPFTGQKGNPDVQREAKKHPGPGTSPCDRQSVRRCSPRLQRPGKTSQGFEQPARYPDHYVNNGWVYIATMICLSGFSSF